MNTSSRVWRRFFCLLGVSKAYTNLISLIFQRFQIPRPPPPTYHFRPIIHINIFISTFLSSPRNINKQCMTSPILSSPLNIKKQCMTSPISEIFFFNLASKSILQKANRIGGCRILSSLFVYKTFSVTDWFVFLPSSESVVFQLVLSLHFPSSGFTNKRQRNMQQNECSTHSAFLAKSR